MSRRHVHLGRLLLAMVAIAVLLAGAPAGRAATPSVHFTAAGDYKMTAETQSVLTAIAARKPQFHLALGDLSYGRTGDEHLWCDFVKRTVGTTLPFQLVTGNHESSGANGTIEAFAKCLPNRMAGMVGTYGRLWYVDVPADKPIMRVLMASPNIVFPEGQQTYAKGTAEYAWVSNAIDDARARNYPWVVAGMHYPCLGIGKYGCTLGSDMLNLLIQKRVDLVLNGHEHNYSRTHQIGYGVGCEGPTLLHHTSYDADCVRDGDARMTPGAGTVFATVGTGGTSLRDLVWTDVEAPYFAAASGLNALPSWGVLDIEASATHLTARFVPSLGQFHDTFTIGDPSVPNPPPTPTDTDADGVSNAVDLCPRRWGPRLRFGCPSVVVGTTGRDLMFGTRLGERILGGLGNDTIHGRGGNDQIVGGRGRDILWGGDGNDTIVSRDGSRDIVYCGAGWDVAIADRLDTVRGCERVRR